MGLRFSKLFEHRPFISVKERVLGCACYGTLTSLKLNRLIKIGFLYQTAL